ncbi:MAG: hypothetical protein ACRDHY_06300, partial [Anaerolineales bacterium]
GQAILDYLKGQEAPVEEASIHDAVEGRKWVKQRALRRLVEAGHVLRSGQGRRGAPYLYASSVVSGFLTPSIYGESAESETESGGNPHSDATISDSRDSADNDSDSRDTEADSADLPPFARKAAELFGATVLSNTPAPKEGP